MSDDHNSTDEPAGSSPSGDGAPEYHSGPRENEVSLLDILLVLARHKTLIARTVLVFTLLGVTYSILAPLEYTSETKVVREAEGKGPDLSGGLGGLAGGLAGGAISGILGGASSGLGPEAFPEVLQGRTVRLSVARDTFRFPDAERPMTFVDYVNRPPSLLDQMLKYTIWLPWTLKGALGRAISDSSTPEGTSGAEKSVILSEEEEAAIRVLQERVSESIDEETGLMSIFVTAGGAQLASDLTESFLRHFTTRVRELRTEKVRKRLAFVERRFREAEEELETAEERLARFLDRNQNPTTATLQFRRDRLQRQVTFKEQLYSKLQSQLTQTRLELQRKQPVVTVVEEPVPPLSRSSPQRTLIVIFSLVLGGFVGIGISFVSSVLQVRRDDPRKREKIEELREEFTVGKYWRELKGKL
jgi:LPS O-antigen subunit length determinant protein (WzzB/FepE family)